MLKWLRKKPAPVGKTKPGPTPLEEALLRIAETMREADERTERMLVRLRKRDQERRAS